MFLHLSAGLLLSILASWLTGEKSFLLVLFGAASALFPDFDFLYYWLKSGCKIHKRIFQHRELLHKPLHPFIVGCAAGFYYLGGFAFGFLFCLNIVVHFFIDQFSDDWGGIQWLWPFNRREWSSKTVDVHIRFKQLEEEYTLNGRTIREGLIFLAALATTLLWFFVLSLSAG